MTVYLLHFNQPYKHAKHYIGYTAKLGDRMARHRAGRGARLIQVIQDAGIDWQLVRTWPDGTRRLERQLKNRKHSDALCPVCRTLTAYTKPRKRYWP